MNEVLLSSGQIVLPSHFLCAASCVRLRLDKRLGEEAIYSRRTSDSSADMFRTPTGRLCDLKFANCSEELKKELERTHRAANKMNELGLQRKAICLWERCTERSVESQRNVKSCRWPWQRKLPKDGNAVTIDKSRAQGYSAPLFAFIEPSFSYVAPCSRETKEPEQVLKKNINKRERKINKWGLID